MKITRVVCAPNHCTFKIPAIKKLLEFHLPENGCIVDPFARESKLGTITNDINPLLDTDYNLPADVFAHMLYQKKIAIDCVLFDPPYTRRQMLEMYQGYGLHFGQDESQQFGHWSTVKGLLAPLIKKHGLAISFGYHTNGFGKSLGFEIYEILICAHGGGHYDTLVTVEEKIL